MRVLYVVPYLGAKYGGIAKVVTGIAQAVGRAGAQADIITTDADGEQRQAVVHHTWISEDGYRVMYFPCWHRQDFILSRPLVRWFRQHGQAYDLVHTHSIFAPLIAAVQWQCRQHGWPYVTTPHGMLEPWALAYKAWKKRTYYALVERPALRGARLIQATASREAEHIQALGLETPIELIPNGLHRAEFETLPAREVFYAAYPALRDKRLLLFLGASIPKRGLICWRRPLPGYTPNTRTPTCWWWDRTTSAFSHGQRSFAAAGCLESVTFAGWMSGPLLYAMLRSVELHIAPSYSEGFSMGILMCLAAGAPTIMTDGCNFPEAGAAGAACIVECSVESIAQALDRYLGDPAAARTMGARGRAFILDHYTWERVAQKLLATYERILAT